MLNPSVRNGLVSSGDVAGLLDPSCPEGGRPGHSQPTLGQRDCLPPREAFPMQSSLEFLLSAGAGAASHSLLNKGSKIFKMQLSFVFNTGEK